MEKEEKPRQVRELITYSNNNDVLGRFNLTTGTTMKILKL